MNIPQNILNITILALFLSVFIFGMLSLPLSHHHEPGCPFMVGEQSICPMGTLEHISVWKSIFNTSATFIFVYLTFIFAGFYIFKKNHPPNFLILLRRFKQDNFSDTNLYQELFSQGILNPKAP